MRAPLRKIFIARYVLYLEIIGFLIMGVIIAGMIFCVIYQIDDTARIKSDDLPLTIEHLTLPSRVYVDAVQVKDGDAVAKGQRLLTVQDDPADLALMETRLDLAAAAEALTSLTLNRSLSPDVGKSVQAALAGAQAIALTHPPKPTTAPLNGIVKGDALAQMAHTMRQGQVCDVHNWDELRFEARVSGKNTDRVNISLLGPRDVLEWRELTRMLKAPDPPPSPSVRQFWELANKDDVNFKDKLKFIAAGSKPDNIGRTDVVTVMNNVLRLKELYPDAGWAPANLPPEARSILRKGVKDLTDNELFRLNRLLLEKTFPGWFETSPNVHQPVKAKILIPRPSRRLPNGLEEKQKPIIFPMTGETLSDKSPTVNILDGSYGVTIVLRHPAPEVQDYLKRRLAKPKMDKVIMTGSVVVGKIPVFRFLFSKE